MKTYSRIAILIVCFFAITAGTGSTAPALHQVHMLTVIADGTGPIPTCRPGTTCGDDQLRQIADGTGPIPTCRPGTTCGDDQERQSVTLHRNVARHSGFYMG